MVFHFYLTILCVDHPKLPPQVNQGKAAFFYL